jgi:SNF2 family DNA or RNA helicase
MQVAGDCLREVTTQMLTPDKLHGYQQKAVNFQCSIPHSMLWLDMGLGKSVITLTSIVHLLNAGFLRGVVIVAPIRVIRLVWRQEAMKWSHTQHLKFSMLTGTRDQRTRALLRPADIYLVNYENLGWLADTLDTYFHEQGRQIPFNGSGLGRDQQV